MSQRGKDGNVQIGGKVKEEACIALTAFGYFSRLPIPARLAFSEARLAASGRYFPIVGLVIGLIAALVYYLAASRLPLSLAVLLSMAASLLATGALHEDGLADCCDAFGGGHSRDDVLRIMKDSRIGAFGAIGLVLALLIKWQALVAIANAAATPPPGGSALLAGYSLPGTSLSLLPAFWITAAHMASRAGAIVYVSTLRYARLDGKAKPFATRSWPSTCVALLLGLPGLFWMGNALGTLLLAVGLSLHLWLGRWFSRRLHGYTGDCLGLAQQIFEIAIYLVVLGWISS